MADPKTRAQMNVTRRKEQALKEARGVGGAGMVKRSTINNLKNARQNAKTLGAVRRKKPGLAAIV